MTTSPVFVRPRPSPGLRCSRPTLARQPAPLPPTSRTDAERSSGRVRGAGRAAIRWCAAGPDQSPPSRWQRVLPSRFRVGRRHVGTRLAASGALRDGALSGRRRRPIWRRVRSRERRESDDGDRRIPEARREANQEPNVATFGGSPERSAAGPFSADRWCASLRMSVARRDRCDPQTRPVETQRTVVVSAANRDQLASRRTKKLEIRAAPASPRPLLRRRVGRCN